MLRLKWMETSSIESQIGEKVVRVYFFLQDFFNHENQNNNTATVVGAVARATEQEEEKEKVDDGDERNLNNLKRLVEIVCRKMTTVQTLYVYYDKTNDQQGRQLNYAKMITSHFLMAKNCTRLNNVHVFDDLFDDSIASPVIKMSNDPNFSFSTLLGQYNTSYIGSNRLLCLPVSFCCDINNNNNNNNNNCSDIDSSLSLIEEYFGGNGSIDCIKKIQVLFEPGYDGHSRSRLTELGVVDDRHMKYLCEFITSCHTKSLESLEIITMSTGQVNSNIINLISTLDDGSLTTLGVYLCIPQSSSSSSETTTGEDDAYTHQTQQLQPSNECSTICSLFRALGYCNRGTLKTVRLVTYREHIISRDPSRDHGEIVLRDEEEEQVKLAFQELLLNNWYLTGFDWESDDWWVEKELCPLRRFKSLISNVLSTDYDIMKPSIVRMWLELLTNYCTYKTSTIPKPSSQFYVDNKREIEKLQLDRIYRFIRYYNDILVGCRRHPQQRQGNKHKLMQSSTSPNKKKNLKI